MSKEIPLRGKRGSGKYAIVDDDQFDELNKYKWYMNKNGYAYRDCIINNQQRIYFMHRQILGLNHNEKRQSDHIDRNRINNQKNNLRICDSKNNSYNKSSYKNSSSKYKGVSYIKRINKWFVHLQVDGKEIFGGYFKDEYIAAIRYDELARKYHGEFAYLNFPDITDYFEIIQYLNKEHALKLNKKTSKYIGVSWNNKKWLARYKNKIIGRFDNEEEAMQAYLNIKESL